MVAFARSCFSARPWLFAVVTAAALSGCGGGGGGDASGSMQPPPASEQPTTPTQPTEPTPPTPPLAEAPRITGWSGLGNPIVGEGFPLTLSVTATGTAPISYQWYRNGAPIDGATESSYTPTLVAADSGVQFYVTVSNSAGQVTSAAATVTVNPPYILPTITQYPENQTIVAGQSVTLSVSATSPTPLSYQWRLEGVDIDGATDASYTTPPLTAGPVRHYSVEVTNLSGSVYGGVAFVFVDPPPPQVIPKSVDPNVQSYLAALGSLSENAGEQTVPATGDATVTVSSYERVDELPIHYDATLQLNELQHDEIAYGAGFSSLQQSLSLTRHVEGTVAGFDLDRYDGVLPMASGRSNVGMDIIIAARSDFEVGIGNWKYIGGEQVGYWSGIPAARGSFILGEPTDAAEIQEVSSGTYEGFSHGGLEFELLFIQAFEEFSSAAHVTYDETTHELTLTLDGFQTYEGSLDTLAMISNWPVFEAGPTNALNAGAIFSCVLTVDPGTNEFSCELSYGGSEPSGTFKGKFYGPEGNEIAGTFALTGLIRYSLYDGMVGAVALKRVP